jgi:hypothetical protein
MEKRDVHAALEARRELGPAYDDEVVDALLAKIDERLDHRPPAAAPARHGPWLAAVISIALAFAAREVRR